MHAVLGKRDGHRETEMEVLPPLSKGHYVVLWQPPEVGRRKGGFCLASSGGRRSQYAGFRPFSSKTKGFASFVLINSFRGNLLEHRVM